VRTSAQLVDKLPGFAPAWCKWAPFAGDPSARLDAIERGLAAHPDGETMGMLQLNKAFTLNQLGDHQSAVALVREIAANPESTAAVEALAKDCLARGIVATPSQGV
jgi:hypothetical protein